MGAVAEAILRAAKNLRIPIPAPAPVRPREKASWRKLKPGQRLLSQQDMVIAGKRIPRESVWLVRATFDTGAQLETEFGSYLVAYYLSEERWDQWHFKRAGKVKGTKTK